MPGPIKLAGLTLHRQSMERKRLSLVTASSVEACTYCAFYVFCLLVVSLQVFSSVSCVHFSPSCVEWTRYVTVFSSES